MSRSAAGAARLHAEDSGSGERAFVLLHHFAGSGRAWSSVIAALGPQQRCLTLDLSGFGRSQVGPAMSVEAHVDDVLEAIARLNLPRYALVGHSMGGKIAFAAAARRPAGLEGLVLVAPSPPWPEPMTDEARAEQLAAFADAAAAAKRLDRLATRPIPAAARARLVADSLSTSREAWQWWLEAGSLENLGGRVLPPGLPVQVVAGASDPLISPTLAGDLARWLYNSALIDVPRAGHLLPDEAPGELAMILGRFFAFSRAAI